MLKKITAVCLIICCCFCMTGCWSSVEIDNTAMAAGMAIDKGKNGMRYHIAVEIIDIASGMSENGQNSFSSKIVECDSNTILDGIRKLISITSEKLYFGHCRSLIIGEDIAKDGISPILDIAFIDHELRLTMDVIITKGIKARDALLKKPISDTMISYGIDKGLDNDFHYLGISSKRELFEFVNDLSREGHSAAVPAVSPIKVNKIDTLEIYGSAIFKKDKLIGYLDQEQSKCLLFVTNHINNGQLNFPMKQNGVNYSAAKILESKTHIVPEEKNGKLRVIIKIKTSLSLDDFSCSPSEITKIGFAKIKKNIEKEMNRKIENTIHEVQQKYGCDVFGIGNSLKDDYNSIWQKHQSHWTEEFQTLPIVVESNVQIRSNGLTYKKR